MNNFSKHDLDRCDYLKYKEIYYELSDDVWTASVYFYLKHFTELDELASIEGGNMVTRNGNQAVTYTLQTGDTKILMLAFDISDVDEDIVVAFKEKLRLSVLEV